MSATSSKLANGSQTMSFQSNSCQSLRVTCAIWDKKMFCPQRFICRWWKPVLGAVRVSVNANSVEDYTLETKTSNPRWCYIRLLLCDVKETRLKKIFFFVKSSLSIIRAAFLYLCFISLTMFHPVTGVWLQPQWVRLVAFDENERLFSLFHE